VKSLDKITPGKTKKRNKRRNKFEGKNIKVFNEITYL
jgi:hypothetical protein